MALQEPERAPRPVTIPDAAGINPLRAARILTSAGAGLFAQATLHGELARIEWAEERGRLLKMLVVTLLGFACLLCVLLAAGALALSVSWDTTSRIPVAMALTAAYALGTVIAWRRFQALAALGDRGFAATREEFAADVALLRSQR